MRARIVALALVLGGCASDVDTLLGLDAVITSSSVGVRADTAGDVVSTTMDVDYRVGTYSEMGSSFQPRLVAIFLGDAPIAMITPSTPTGFVADLSPGQSASTTLTGETSTATNPRSLCGAEARLLLQWRDGTTGDPGMVETTTTDVTCE